MPLLLRFPPAGAVRLRAASLSRAAVWLSCAFPFCVFGGLLFCGVGARCAYSCRSFAVRGCRSFVRGARSAVAGAPLRFWRSLALRSPSSPVVLAGCVALSPLGRASACSILPVFWPGCGLCSCSSSRFGWFCSCSSLCGRARRGSSRFLSGVSRVSLRSPRLPPRFPACPRSRVCAACPSPLRLRRPVAPGVGPPGLACGLLSPFPAASCASVAEYFASLNANLPAKYFSRSSTRLYASMRWKIILRPRSALSQNFFF